MTRALNPPRVSRVAWALLALAACTASGQTSLASRIDAIATAPIVAGQVAGASIAVVKGTETIVEKAYGFADLQLDVPTPPRAVYEIGSVTKQFTAAAILLLVEDGKLSLDDELTKHFPDYPTQRHRVTIRHLLNHTSGIKGYTEMPEFRTLAMQKKPRQELVQLFSSQPFAFAPGEDVIYNNSAFFLLGLVIEKVSGTPYAEFVQTRLFDKAGMKDSSYCSERQVRQKKVQGYDMDNGTLVLKAYLDHTWPYAAGSLCSTAYDLVLWNRALHGGQLMRAESYQAMTSPGVLNDGTRIRYAMGITVFTSGGRRIIAHGGGINGFLSHLAYYPDDDLTIAVLMNTAGLVNPQGMAQEIAEAVLGKGTVTTSAFEGDITPFVGTYAGRGRGGPTEIRIEARGTDLHLLRGSGASATDERLHYLGNDTFGFRDTLLIVQRENGRISWVRLDTITGNVALSRAPPGLSF